MRITGFHLYPYRIPFAGPFQTARGGLKVREGVLLRLATDTGLVGWGEAAPLPEFGGGSVEDALAWLAAWQPQVLNSQVEQVEHLVQAALVRPEPGLKAALCALDMAACDLLAQKFGLSLAGWLAGDSPAAGEVAVNATVTTPIPGVAAGEAAAAVGAGFECVKLKVGVLGDPQAEIERVLNVRAAIGPDIRLRLDANGVWPVEQAVAILRELEPAGLELVEQPVAACDLAGMRTVRRQVTVPVAADEPVTGPREARRIIEAEAADILVIKPMSVGGLRPARQIIELAQAAGLACLVTTTLDTGVGIAAALHLAAGLPAPVLHCGLATAHWLETTLTADLPPVRRGRMEVPSTPGLGITIDESRLTRYTL